MVATRVDRVVDSRVGEGGGWVPKMGRIVLSSGRWLRGCRSYFTSWVCSDFCISW